MTGFNYVLTKIVNMYVGMCCTATINHCTLQLHANQLVCHLVQGQNTLTFRGRSRSNKEDFDGVLYQEEIEVSTYTLTAPS